MAHISFKLRYNGSESDDRLLSASLAGGEEREGYSSSRKGSLFWTTNCSCTAAVPFSPSVENRTCCMLLGDEEADPVMSSLLAESG